MKALRILLPPVHLFVSLVLMLLLDYVLPLHEFRLPYARTAGIIILLSGLGLIIYCAGLFRRAETPIIPFEKSTRLISSGIYRYSRNPIYLGMLIILTGAAIALGSLSPLFVIPLFYLIILHGYILDEEIFLERLFGEEYTRYCKQVRRWF